MTTYWVIAATTAEGLELAPLTTLFATPFQAETYRDGMSLSHSGYTYKVRPATWKEREHRMFIPDPHTHKAVYTLPVWSDESWWCGVAHQFKDMYVHVSTRDPSAIAFTEDEAKGEADRQTMMRPGKWLQKFLGEGPSGTIEHGPLQGWPPQISKMKVAYYAQWHQVGKRPESDDTLMFADTPDEIVRVYEDGPPSCMVDKHWPDSDHPTRVYAGGDLAVAYLNNASGDVIARALCWPAKSVFGRVYPTVVEERQRAHYDELMARLKALGWTSITEDRSVFEGARLRHLTDRKGRTIMPYLDNDYGVRSDYVDGRSVWRMTHDEDHQDSQKGVMVGEDEDDWSCESCNDGYSDEEDACSVYSYWQGYPRGEERWCDSCRSNNTFYCEGSEEYYSDSTDYVCVYDNCYQMAWFEANGGWQCEHSGEYYFRDDDEPVVLADGMLMHTDCVEEGTFVCLVTGLRWPKAHQSRAVPGYHYAYDSHDPHPVEWENVLPEPPDDDTLQAWGVMFAGGTWPPAAQADLFISNPLDPPPLLIDLATMPTPVIRPILHAIFTS